MNDHPQTNFEDLSTLGGGENWDGASANTSFVDNASAGGNSNPGFAVGQAGVYGDIGEDDIAADKEEYFAANAMVW